VPLEFTPLCSPPTGDIVGRFCVRIEGNAGAGHASASIEQPYRAPVRGYSGTLTSRPSSFRRPIRSPLNGKFGRVRVHDLEHTVDRRLPAAGVAFDDRQDLLGHKSTRITSHYSAPELANPIFTANTVCSAEPHKIPPSHGFAAGQPGEVRDGPRVIWRARRDSNSRPPGSQSQRLTCRFFSFNHLAGPPSLATGTVAHECALNATASLRSIYGAVGTAAVSFQPRSGSHSERY